MRSALLMVTLLSLALGVGGCGDDQEPQRARDFWERIQAEDYRSWARAPGYEGREPSRAAHGDEVEIFVNDVVVADLALAEANEWSDGAVIVKDGYDDGELCFVAGMAKEDGEWFWVEYDGEGDTLYSGAPSLCTGCHELGDDFVRAFFLP